MKSGELPTKYVLPAALASMQFPFQAVDNPHQKLINEESHKILSGIEDMLYQHARKRARGQLDEDQVREIVQRCRIWLWEKSLPKYDNHRNVKISTYLFQCSDNFFKQEVRSISRRRTGRRRMTYVDPDLMLQTIQASDQSMDARIAAVAEDVIKSPEKYLTQVQVEVFRAMVNNPHVLMKDLAAKLGYKRPSSLSMMMRRIRERIMEIDVEDHVACQLKGAA